MKLWVKPIPKRLRFHDLRHTCATLLLKNGTPLVVVQKILRHTDPKLTSEVYGHIDLGDLCDGFARFRIIPVPKRAEQEIEENPVESLVVAAAASEGTAVAVAPSGLLLTCCWAPGTRKPKALRRQAFTWNLRAFVQSGRLDLNQRPLAPQAGA